MKFLRFGFFTFSALVALATSPGSALAERGDHNFVGRVYSGSCRFENPLDTYERCSAYSEAGYTAGQCAEAEAFRKCKVDFAQGCQMIGVSYRTIISQEFVGYKACEVTVSLRGFRPTN